VVAVLLVLLLLEDQEVLSNVEGVLKVRLASWLVDGRDDRVLHLDCDCDSRFLDDVADDFLGLDYYHYHQHHDDDVDYWWNDPDCGD
jgi:hypothetical protein